HTPNAMGAHFFGKLSLRQQTLDVVQLHKCVLEGVLKISEEAIRNQENVSYCREAADALLQVRSGKVQVAFLMNPVRMEQVRDIAFAGEVLPQKSTDFYPKLLSGLTIYALEEATQNSATGGHQIAAFRPRVAAHSCAHHGRGCA